MFLKKKNKAVFKITNLRKVSSFLYFVSVEPTLYLLVVKNFVNVLSMARGSANPWNVTRMPTVAVAEMRVNMGVIALMVTREMAVNVH